MAETISFGLSCFTSLFTLITPLGTMPIFMTMTADLNEQGQSSYLILPAPAFSKLDLASAVGNLIQCLFYVRKNVLHVF
jgi:small neutral amino acid transporter SnatA (MarC family)